MNPINLTSSNDSRDWEARNYPISEEIWVNITERERRYPQWSQFRHMYIISDITFGRSVGS